MTDPVVVEYIAVAVVVAAAVVGGIAWLIYTAGGRRR